MAPRSFTRRLFVLSFLLVFLTSAGFPLAVQAAPSADVAAIPDLTTFAASVMNGNGKVLRGIHVEGLFAYPVVQQVYSAEVSELPATLTQFGWPTSYGVTGVLAHNWLTGADFFQLRVGQKIHLVYGDGRTVTYWVNRLYRYQATTPESPYSQFIDLDTGKGTDAEGVFRKVYMGDGHVTFQTCIERDGELSWGRLFVIAEQFEPVPAAPPEERVAFNTLQ
jgi:hypothetical protein